MAFIRMATGTESNRYFLCQMLFFSFTEKSFLPAARGDAYAPPILYAAFCTPLFFFSCREKEERPAGVEEKEGRLLSVCRASPTGAE